MQGYFLNCSKVDMNDNELGILELIHLFVEVLDGYFGNVCELDLVFHFDKARPVSRRCQTATVSLSFDFPEMRSLSVLYSLQLAIFAPSAAYKFDTWQVYRILDELLLAGEVSETSTSKIIAIMKSVDKMD